MSGRLNSKYMKELKKQFSFHLNQKPTLVIVDWFNLWKKHKNIEPKPLFDYLKTYPEIYQIRFYNGLIKGKDWSQKILGDARSAGYEVISKLSKLQPIDIREADHFQSILKSLDILFDDIKSTNNNISKDLYSYKDSVESGVFEVFSNIDIKLKAVDQNIASFKEESKKPILKVKCDFDAEIARDIILEIGKYDNLILFSGDGDFASTVKYLVNEKSKKVFVIFNRGSWGLSDYCENGLIEQIEKMNKKGRKYYDPISANKDQFVFIDFSKIENAIKQQLPEDFSSGRPDTANIADSDKEVKVIHNPKI